MNDMTPFEQRLEDRVRTFALSGVRPVDSAAVARSVITTRQASGVGWLRLAFDGRALFALAMAAIAVLALVLLPRLQDGLVGRSPEPTRTPAPTATKPPEDRLGLAYALNGDVYIAVADGTSPIRIVDSDPVGECPDLVEGDGLVSPDGRHIAYRSDTGEDCENKVVITDLNGRVVVAVSGSGRGVAWSPDSTRVATWLTWRGPTIGVYGLDGVRQAVIDGSSVCCDQDWSRPVWSHDAASLLIRRHNDGTPTEWELPLNGDPARPVPQDDPRSRSVQRWLQDQIVYSPDGALQAFTEIEARFEQPNSLVVAARDGTQPRKLVHAGQYGEIGGLAWSPTDDQIAYVQSDVLTVNAVGEPLRHEEFLRLVDPATGSITTLVSIESTYGHTLRSVGFSTDGDRLVFARDDEDGHSSLWVATADGSEVRVLVDGTSDGGWVVLPDTAPNP